MRFVARTFKIFLVPRSHGRIGLASGVLAPALLLALVLPAGGAPGTAPRLTLTPPSMTTEN